MSIQKNSLKTIPSGFLGPFHIRHNRSELPIYTVHAEAWEKEDVPRSRAKFWFPKRRRKNRHSIVSSPYRFRNLQTASEYNVEILNLGISGLDSVRLERCTVLIRNNANDTPNTVDTA